MWKHQDSATLTELKASNGPGLGNRNFLASENSFGKLNSQFLKKNSIIKPVDYFSKPSISTFRHMEVMEMITINIF